MYENTEKFVDLDFEQHVRQAAYHLWEDDGRPFGQEKQYWFKAMEQLLAERSTESDVGKSKRVTTGQTDGARLPPAT